MLRLLLTLINIASSHKIIVDLGYDIEGIASIIVITLDSYGDYWPVDDVAIRPYHDGTCTFLTSSIMELTFWGMAYFDFVCICPDFSPCTVNFAAEYFVESYIDILSYFGDNFVIVRQIDKFWVTVGHFFNIIANYFDEDGYTLDSPIKIDDTIGEIMTITTIADQKNGHAEFNASYPTAGFKTVRIITNYLLYSYVTGYLVMNQIAITRINVVNELKITGLILNNNDASKQIIWTNEPFIVTLQAFEPGTTKVDTKEQSLIQITISSSESENVTFSKMFTNGVATFDKLSVLNYGSYNIVAISDGFSDTVLSKNVTGYLSIYFKDSAPFDYNTYFSIGTEVFKDSLFYIKDSKASVFITLTINPTTEFIGTLYDITKSGKMLFEYLKIPKEGTYTINASSQWMASAVTPMFTINETDKIYSIELATNSSTNSVKINDTILIIANLFDYKNQKYSKNVKAFIQISPLLYIGNTVVDSILDKAYFLISLTSISTYHINATTMLDYKNVVTNTLNITVYDIYCGINGVYTKNSEIVNGICQCQKMTTYNIDTNECVCIENTIYNEYTLKCECNEPFKYKNGRCVYCIRSFVKENVTAFYDENYIKIFISYSTKVLEAGPLDCLYLINLPSSLKKIIKSCEWLGNSVMILRANSTIIPDDYYIELNETLTPDKGECYENPESVKIPIDKKYPGLYPDFEIQAPVYASKGNCQSNQIVVSCVPDDNNFSFLWTISEINTIFTTNPIELDITDFSGTEILITLNVNYIPFNTSAEKTISISLSNDLLLKVVANIGKKYSMTKSEIVELKPILLDSCGVGNSITEYFFKFISGSIPYFINTMIENRERDNMLLINGQELDVGTFTIRVGIVIQDFSGYEDTQITILYDDISIFYDRWDGIQGLDNDLAISATTNSTDDKNIVYKWNCFSGGNQYCVDSQNESIFINPMPNKFLIYKYKLQDLANYTIVCYAQNSLTKKSATKEIHIQINNGYYGSLLIDSITDMVKTNQEVIIYPRANYDNNVNYVWDIYPLLENCNIDVYNLILRIPPLCLKNSMIYTLTLTALQGNPIGKVETSLQTSVLPKCSNFSIEFLQTQKWKFDAVNCSSVNSRITYQFGYKSSSDSIIWLTGELETNTIDVFLEDSITLAVVRVADHYGWIDIESYIIKRSRVISDNPNMQLDYMNTNSDTLLADFKYFMQEIMETSDYFKFIDKIIVYFTTGKMTQGTFNSYLSFLETCSQTGAFDNPEYSIKFINATIKILENYNTTLEDQEFQVLMSIFSVVQFSYKVADFYLISANYWSRSVYPYSYGKYSSNIEIAYNQLSLETLNKIIITLKNMKISLTKTSELDENYLYKLLYFYINPLNFGIFIYKIAEKISDFSYIPLKNPELVTTNNVTYKIQLTSNEYVYSDYCYSLFSYNNSNETTSIERIDSDNLNFYVNDNGFFTIASPNNNFRSSIFNLIGIIIVAFIPTFSSIIANKISNENMHIDNYFREIVDLRNFFKEPKTYILPIMIMQFFIGYLVNLFYNLKMKQRCNRFEAMDFFESFMGSLIYNIGLGTILIVLYYCYRNRDALKKFMYKIYFWVLFNIWLVMIAGIIVLEIITRTCFNIYWFVFTFIMHLAVTPGFWILLRVSIRDSISGQVYQIN
ncbi:hypothetical protein SteCoe_3544 [Stentor coeruleus]|uniref:Uncharacterized protein n=1 Tax=Stentor coeruleus TaxID=5963 RepID=A0A1R2CWP1_9CILI|nr:hypothetical protein SteCoe_3544 [Stentor coeruleus]